MTYDQAITTGAARLKSTSDSPALDSEVLLTFACKVSREKILTHPEIRLTGNQARIFLRLIKQRRSGIPVAYLTGKKNFFGRDFAVTKDVLVPRPETEGLVELALKEIHACPRVLTILDLGTGSGCIAVTLKLAGEKKTMLTATDISIKALAVARKNSLTYKTKIKFVKSDLFSKLSSKFDLIVSNPPYVPFSEYRKNFMQLKKEPRLALTDKSNDFRLFNKLIPGIAEHLREKGVALLEIHPKMKTNNRLISLAKKSRLSCKFFKDLSGKWRYLRLEKI